MEFDIFRVPKIVFGYGSLKYLKEVRCKMCVVVTGKGSMRKLGFLDKTLQYLGNCEVFEGIEENPTISTVLEGAEFMRNIKPDTIVGIGGGSAIDAAKAMMIFYEHPEVSFEDIAIKRCKTVPKLKTRFIAIPSTSGTATEVSAGSVITDTHSKIKYPIVSDEIVPDLAIVDPELTLSMPKYVTANTGLDALTHAVESYVCKYANEFTKPLARNSVRLILKYLPKAYENGRDRKAREMMHYASTMAGAVSYTHLTLPTN